MLIRESCYGSYHYRFKQNGRIAQVSSQPVSSQESQFSQRTQSDSSSSGGGVAMIGGERSQFTVNKSFGMAQIKHSLWNPGNFCQW